MSVKKLALDIAQTVDEKGKSYGDAIGASAELMRVLYPNGIPPEQTPNALLFVRLFDKMKRLVTEPNAFGENPWRDMAGYCIRGAEKAEAPGTLFGIKTLDTCLVSPKQFDALLKLEQDFIAAHGGINSVVRGEPEARLKTEAEFIFEQGRALANDTAHQSHLNAHQELLDKEEKYGWSFDNCYKASYSWKEIEQAALDELLLPEVFRLTDEDCEIAVDVIAELVANLSWEENENNLWLECFDTLRDLGWDTAGLNDLCVANDKLNRKK